MRAHISAGQQALAHFVFSGQAWYRPDLGRRETWDEAVTRVFDMHRLAYAGIGVGDLIEETESAVRERLVLGSQRAMQFAGAPILSKHARLYNCSASYADRPRFFQEALWLLLCGVGVGCSVQRHHVRRLPRIAQPHPGEPVTYQVDDSIEGWSDALGALVSSYVTDEFPCFATAGRRVRFDFSRIRPAGASILGGIGVAPGPDPLAHALERVRSVFEACLDEAGGQSTPLRPIHVYDILMHASDCVYAGGVRRSAAICLFSPDDREMAMAKTGDWITRNPHRARSNNSAVLVRDQTPPALFRELMASVREYGEPGFVWSPSTEVVFNPCCEIGLYPVDEETRTTGWQMCNLTEINMRAVTGAVEGHRAARAAAILGTLQAGYARMPYLGEVSETIIRRESLLGVSMTGMADNPDVAFDPSMQQGMARVVLDTNADVARRIGIPVAARATCVKPAGTTSCILGTASGIHPYHARRFLRRVQTNAANPLLPGIAASQPAALERSVWNPHGTDWVVSFPIEVPEHAAIRADVDASAQLARVISTYANWVLPGTRAEQCVLPGITHNVSNTLTVRDREWEDITEAIYANREAVTGISLLPHSGDLDYPQAPFVEVLRPEQIVALFGPVARWGAGLVACVRAAWDGDIWGAADTALGRRPMSSDIERDAEQSRFEALESVRVFADLHADGNLPRVWELIKRVHLAEVWHAVTATPVDPAQWTTDAPNCAIGADSACAGGTCEIVRA